MATRIIHPKPDIQAGVRYWQGVEASVDGVLGGYGTGTLPRIDAQGSRTFLLRVLPRLSASAPTTHPSGPGAWIEERVKERGGPGMIRSRALDCGAGVGRVTRDVLSRIVDCVHLIEPAEHFLQQAKLESAKWPAIEMPISSQPLQARKLLHFHLGTLQGFDPAQPWTTSGAAAASLPPMPKKAKVDDAAQVSWTQPTLSSGEHPSVEAQASVEAALATKEPVQYDVVWCQWCLQHLSDPDLKLFLKAAQKALVPGSGEQQAEGKSNAVLDGGGVIVIKENVCQEEADGTERVWYDEEDKSITRSTKAYERVFKEAGLEIVRSEVQHGLPEELFVVRMWALR